MMDMLKSVQEEIKFLKANNKKNSKKSNISNNSKNSNNNSNNSDNSEDSEGSIYKGRQIKPRFRYCWSHGYFWYTSEVCKGGKKDGHHNSNTLANKKGGSTANFPNT